jgi:hypothetical protein
MLWFVIQQLLLSLILIAIVHYIYEFLKNNLTEPKIKDLVNKPKVKYEQIYKNVSSDTQQNPESSANMKVELQNYLQELSKNNNTTPNGVATGDNLFDNNYQTI